MGEAEVTARTWIAGRVACAGDPSFFSLQHSQQATESSIVRSIMLKTTTTNYSGCSRLPRTSILSSLLLVTKKMSMWSVRKLFKNEINYYCRSTSLQYYSLHLSQLKKTGECTFKNEILMKAAFVACFFSFKNFKSFDFTDPDFF